LPDTPFLKEPRPLPSTSNNDSHSLMHYYFLHLSLFHLLLDSFRKRSSFDITSAEKDRKNQKKKEIQKIESNSIYDLLIFSSVSFVI
jgi:hypothetical protein